jgi:hypothetical protein
MQGRYGDGICVDGVEAVLKVSCDSLRGLTLVVVELTVRLCFRRLNLVVGGLVAVGVFSVSASAPRSKGE